MALSLRFAAVSHIGRVRQKNDDSGYAGPHLLLVADGMGGAPAGDLASAVTVQTIRRLDKPPPADMLEALAGSIHRANDRLSEILEHDATVEGMGTTVTAVLFDGERIGLAHMGDSRGYLFHDGTLQQVTSDHTWVQSLVDEGRITEAEATTHSHRSILLKVLDGRHENDPDLSVHEVQAGDRILLCSDGLSGFVAPDRIERVLQIGSESAAADELIQLALEAGAPDNVTVIIGDVVEDGQETKAAGVTVGAALDQARAPLSRVRGWVHREPDTGELPAVTEAVDPEEIRYAPRPPRRYRWVKRFVLLGLALAVVAALAVVSYSWSQQQYYVSAEGDHVAIYQGVQADLPGISLSHVYERQGLLLSQLPSFRHSQVLDGLTANSLKDARKIVAELDDFALACAARSQPTTSTAPAITATPSRTATVTATTERPRRTTPSTSSSAPSNTPSTGPSTADPGECAGSTPASSETTR